MDNSMQWRSENFVMHSVKPKKKGSYHIALWHAKQHCTVASRQPASHAQCPLCTRFVGINSIPKKPCTAFPLVHWFSIHKTIKITILSLSNLKGWISWLNNRLYTYIHVCMHIKAVLFIAQLQDFLRLQLPCVVDNNGPMGKAYTTVTHFGPSASSA